MIEIVMLRLSAVDDSLAGGVSGIRLICLKLLENVIEIQLC